ncbi:MAG TPA: hypothetical protein VMY99_02600 [Nevskiaceae bacterium]|nr:hypothetical protein [Nevskiaceae bacterium]
MALKHIRHLGKRSGLLLVALVFMAMLAMGAVPFGKQASAAQLTSRSLSLSSSANGAITVGSAGSGSNGQKAQHTVTFTLGTSGATVGSMAIIYCDNPIPQTSCTTPTGLSAVNLTSASVSGQTAGTFSLDTATNNPTITNYGTCNGATTTRNNCVLVKAASGAAQTATPTITITYGGGASNYITNPTTDNQTFYARLVVFSDIGYATPVDNGAVASSTAEQIDITAKVQEKLNFSVSASHTAPGGTCTALSGSGALNLGDSNGVLDSATAYDAHSYFRVSTNAVNGTVIKYSGDTLKSGSNSITALASETLSSPGSSQFGLGLNTGSTEHSFTNLTAATGYDEANGNINPTVAAKFNFSTGSVTTPVTIASVGSGIVSCDTGDVRYIGNIATSTPAGIYTTTITYIAVPTY